MIFDLALIPARAGSKGLPGKNVRTLAGRPLIAWTVAAALESRLFTRIVVSTDSQEIADAAREAGAQIPFLRPASLATDEATSADVVRHALATCSVKGHFALLQPTSPFRTGRHIREAAALYEDCNPPAVVGTMAAKPLAWTYVVGAEGAMAPAIECAEVTRRQDGGTLAQPNGSLYLTSAEQFAHSGSLLPQGSLAYPMDVIASIDIDGSDDFALAEAVAAARGEPRP